MTKAPDSCNDRNRQASAPAGAGEECVQGEIEVTPEVIEAGGEELWSFDGGYFETHEEAAKRIYRAMERARQGSAGGGSPSISGT